MTYRLTCHTEKFELLGGEGSRHYLALSEVPVFSVPFLLTFPYNADFTFFNGRFIARSSNWSNDQRKSDGGKKKNTIQKVEFPESSAKKKKSDKQLMTDKFTERKAYRFKQSKRILKMEIRASWNNFVVTKISQVEIKVEGLGHTSFRMKGFTIAGVPMAFHY